MFHQDGGRGYCNKSGHTDLLMKYRNGRLDRELVERLMASLHRQVTERSAHPSDHIAGPWHMAGPRTAYPVQQAELDKVRPRDHFHAHESKTSIQFGSQLSEFIHG